MTPAEFRAVANGKITEIKRVREESDAFNAFRCYIAAACAGNKDLKVEDFMIFKERKPEKVQSEQDWNNALSSWTGV